jgi:hypothetical protein
VDGGEVQVKILGTAALNALAGPQAPDSRTGDQERDAGSPTRPHSPLLMLKLDSREDSFCFEHSLGWEFDTRSPTVAEVGTGWPGWSCASTAEGMPGRP